MPELVEKFRMELSPSLNMFRMGNILDFLV